MRRAATRSHVVSVVVSSVLGLAGACGHGAGSGGDGGPAVDAAPSVATITVHTGDPPALIAFRDGADAPWQTPVATAPGRYEIVVHGPYTVEVACVADGVAVTLQRSLTPDDPADVDMVCQAGVPASPNSRVTGTMTPTKRGALVLGPAFSFVASSGQFGVAVPDGTYDLIVRSTPGDAATDRIVFRRHLVVAGPTMVTPAIDVAAEGIATIGVTPTVTNLASGETLSALGELIAGTTSFRLQFVGSPPAYVVPDTALEPTDVQNVVVTASGGATGRSVRRRYVQTTSLQFTLPPPLAVQFAADGDRLALSWSSLPPYDVLRTEIGQDTADGNGSVVHEVRLSASYVATTRTQRATFDTDLPGYAAAWRVDFTRPWGRFCETTRTEPSGDKLFSSLSEDVTPAPAGPARVQPGAPAAVWRQLVR